MYHINQFKEPMGGVVNDVSLYLHLNVHVQLVCTRLVTYILA